MSDSKEGIKLPDTSPLPEAYHTTGLGLLFELSSSGCQGECLSGHTRGVTEVLAWENPKNSPKTDRLS
ncbi:MAG: hypothetical protein ACKO0N_06830 [Planctomycetota bacterium]